MWPWRACAHRAPSWAGSSKEADIVRGIHVPKQHHDDARRRHGDHHRRQHPISMSRCRAQLERLAKRGLLLVVNGAPIDAAANMHERPQRRPQATACRCESECSRYCSKPSPFVLKRFHTFEKSFKKSLREVLSRSGPFEKSLQSKSPFCLFRPHSPRSTRATAPRAAVRGGRPRSLCVSLRWADWHPDAHTHKTPPPPCFTLCIHKCT
eukprot:scaffold50314_cov56-Phaeocystis_antarctica.AAC.2